MADYRAPNGSPIVGTAETVLATAWISGIDDEGFPEYSGSSEIHWDTQETNTRGGKLLFVDDSGEEWTFDQLEKIDDQLE